MATHAISSGRAAQSESSGACCTTCASPGKRTQVDAADSGAGGHGPVQRIAEPPAARPGAAPGERAVDSPAHADAREHARTATARGTSGSAQPLPYLDVIQRCFGRHDVGGVKAYLGAEATEGARAVGAAAFTAKERVVFARPPSLFVAAHEAAHVVQQRGGVQLAGDLDEPGDSYERHADAVAERVVRGESAEDLLEVHAGGAAPASDAGHGPVQRFKELPHEVEAHLGVPEGSRLSDSGNLLATGRDAYATEEVIKASNEALIASDARVTLRVGSPLAGSESLASPPGPSLRLAVAEYREASIAPGRPQGIDARRFNTDPAAYTAEASNRMAALDDFTNELRAYADPQTRPAVPKLEVLTSKYAAWQKGWASRSISNTFKNDVEPGAAELVDASEKGKLTWNEVDRLADTYAQLSESYAKDLLPENAHRIVVPGDCSNCSGFLTTPGTETPNEGERVPKIGETMETNFKVPGEVDPDLGWNYHRAATLLKDGHDIVTLETSADPAQPKMTRGNAEYKMYGEQGEHSFWAESWKEYGAALEKRGIPISPTTIARQVEKASALPGTPSAGPSASSTEAGPSGAPTPDELRQVREEVEAAGAESGHATQGAAVSAGQDAGEGASQSVATSVSESTTTFLRRSGKVAGKVLAGIAVVLDSVALSEAIYRDILSGDTSLPNTRPVLGGIIGSWAGAALGAQAGAVVGSLVPGIGTFVGAVVGGIVGGILGGVLGAHVGATTPVGRVVQSTIEAAVPEAGAQARMREKQTEVESSLRDSLASQASQLAHRYTTEPGATIHANLEWKIEIIVASSGRGVTRTLGNVTLSKASYDAAAGPSGTEVTSTGFFVRTEIHTRRETYPVPLSDFLPAQAAPIAVPVTRPPYVVNTRGEAFATS